MKNILLLSTKTTVESKQCTDTQPIHVSYESANLLLPLLQAKSFVGAASLSNSDCSLPEHMLNSKDFWRHLFAALIENSVFNFRISTDGTQAISLSTMNGFTSVKVTDGIIIGTKPAFKAGGTSLKKRNIE